MEALKAELEALNVGQLRKRAADVGASDAAIDDARDTNRPKHALIDLILLNQPPAVQQQQDIRPAEVEELLPGASRGVVKTTVTNSQSLSKFGTVHARSEESSLLEQTWTSGLEPRRDDVDAELVITEHFTSKVYAGQQARGVIAEHYDAPCAAMVEQLEPSSELLSQLLLEGEVELVSLHVVAIRGGPIGMDNMIGHGSIGLTKSHNSKGDDMYRLHFVMQAANGSFEINEYAHSSEKHSKVRNLDRSAAQSSSLSQAMENIYRSTKNISGKYAAITIETGGMTHAAVEWEDTAKLATRLAASEQSQHVEVKPGCCDNLCKLPKCPTCPTIECPQFCSKCPGPCCEESHVEETVTSAEDRAGTWSQHLETFTEDFSKETRQGVPMPDQVGDQLTGTEFKHKHVKKMHSITINHLKNFVNDSKQPNMQTTLLVIDPKEPLPKLMRFASLLNGGMAPRWNINGKSCGWTEAPLHFDSRKSAKTSMSPRRPVSSKKKSKEYVYYGWR